MDNEDVSVLSRGNFPSSAEEFDCAGRTDAAGEVQSKMQIEQSFVRSGSQFGALLSQGFVPGLIGGEPGGAVFVSAIVVGDFNRQEFIGMVLGLDFLVSEEGDQSLLHRAEEPFDFAFGLRRRCHAMIDADR